MIEAIPRTNPYRQFMKFLATGATNTFVDFAILNLCIVIFGLMQGDPRYAYFKAASYIAASVNSFVLNKWWVFKRKATTDPMEIGKFAAVNGVGLVLNTAASLVVFHMISLILSDWNAALLANIGALAGTLVVLMFNFMSYKFIVFKK